MIPQLEQELQDAALTARPIADSVFRTSLALADQSFHADQQYPYHRRS